MKKIEKMVCWICKKEYAGIAEARECESEGLMTPYFKIGDAVVYRTYLGQDRGGANYEERIGTVIDILFPMPTKYTRIGHTFRHAYQVSYLVVRTTKREGGSEKFFDQENIDLLRTLNTVEVVSETDMLSWNNGPHLGPERHRSSLRTVVTSWSDYVAEIEQKNPQLTDRLTRFTAQLRKLDCLD